MQCKRHFRTCPCDGLQHPVTSPIQAKSKTIKRTLNPEFAWEVDVEIWSPFSIVSLRVVDKDFVTKDDPIGFVEFCIADLVPNGDEVRGWLELRKMEHFEGNAKRRFLKHRRRRDDSCNDELDESPLHEHDLPEHEGFEDETGFSTAVRRLNGHGLARSMSRAAETVKSQVKTLQTRVANAHPPRPAMCCAGLKNDDDDETSGFLKWRRKRLNAGEIEVSLKLETTMQSTPNHETPKHELLYTAVFAPDRTTVVSRSHVQPSSNKAL